jgi:pilus assembly protein Flp/PilA
MWAKTATRVKAALRGAGLRDVSGATAVEYGLIGAGIALAIIVAIFAIGDDLVSLFGTVQSALAEDR